MADATTATAAAPTAASTTPVPPAKRLDEFDFDANPTINPRSSTRWPPAPGSKPAAALPDRRLRHRQVHLLIGAGHRRRRGRLPGPLHPGLQAGQRARRSRRRQAAVQDHRPLRPGRSALPRRAGLHGTGPARRRLLFQVLTEREETTAVAIASNEPFSGWTKTFTDPRLCAAIVDRLTFDGHIIETGTTSYRLAHGGPERSKPGCSKLPEPPLRRGRLPSRPGKW